ncbi:hypothetical protein [Streptococcus mitis]|uniref:hypothetical protein n=1 Tax=Streptococcus mitis TaxID=28037 RepID=UPI0001E53AA3|nr:hypothetical protein [Streptococcus mitis]EFN97381.1 hypothetical protein SMSK321_0252 [Streptococcus mitis SK321]
MVERAESTLIEGYILVKTNVRLFQNKYPDHLHNQFRCCDPNCGVPLSCAVWNDKNSKMEPYFYISNHNFPHISGCKEVNQLEKKNRVESDLEYVFNRIQDKKIITLGNISQNRNIETSSSNKNKFDSSSIGTYKKSSTNNSILTKKTQNRISLLDSIIEIFKNPQFDNNTIVKLDFNFQLYQNRSLKSFKTEKDYQKYVIKQKKREQNVKIIKNTHCRSTLNNLFYMISKDLPFNEFHIFYGKAKFWETENYPGLVYVSFDSLDLNMLNNGKKLNFKFNKDYLNNYNKKIVNEALKNKSEVEIYFQGAFSEGESNIYMIPLTIQNYNSIVFR